MKGFVLSVIIASILLSLIALPGLAQGVQSVELHGYMQNRFYANPDSTARFVTERVSLSAVSQLGTDGTAYVELYFPTTYVESAYVDLPLFSGRIRFGKGRQLNFGMTPSYPNRKLATYGIVSETFTSERITGAQYDYKAGAFDFGLSVYTDQLLGATNTGTFISNISTTNYLPHFADKDSSAGNAGDMAVSSRMGLKMGSLTAHISGATGKLSQENLNTLNAPGPTAILLTSTDHNKYGVDAVYNAGPFIAQGELYQGNFSSFKITGYSLLVGYQPKNARRAYVRYEALNYNQPQTANQLTWEPQQLTFGVIQPIRKGVWAEFQYVKNTETGGDVDNDQLFVEVFTGF